MRARKFGKKINKSLWEKKEEGVRGLSEKKSNRCQYSENGQCLYFLYDAAGYVFYIEQLLKFCNKCYIVYFS